MEKAEILLEHSFGLLDTLQRQFDVDQTIALVILLVVLALLSYIPIIVLN